MCVQRHVAMCLIATISLLVGGECTADLRWWDGTIDPADEPPGQLLSENSGYWGEQILTGVTYTYETPPDNPADHWRDTEKFGRRLLDGRASGSWWVPVGTSGKPLIVTFDFKRNCTFEEVDFAAARTKQVGVKIECGDDPEGQWAVAYERGLEDCPEAPFHRIALADGPQGRYLRITFSGKPIIYIGEILVWGDAEVSEENPEVIEAVGAREDSSDITFQSIGGIAKTAFSDAQYWAWRDGMKEHGARRAVWSRVATWDSITNGPILPPAEDTIKEASLVMARNEAEPVAVALTNVTDEPLEVELHLSGFQRRGEAHPSRAGAIAASMRVAGAIPSRHYGVGLGPLLSPDNMLDAGLMRRYLTNGRDIADFPELTLRAAGSAVLWVCAETKNAVPGHYVARLSCEDGPTLLLNVDVVDVALPEPFVWIQTYSRTTDMFPFVYGDRRYREVAYKTGLGVTVWNGFPKPGTAADMARYFGQAIYHIWGLPGDYGHRLYAGRVEADDLTEEDAATIAEHVHSLVRRAEEFGLSYDDWYVELTDEPGYDNSAAYGAFAGIIKRADPRVNIYANPSFWVGGGVMEDEKVHEVLGDWYRECIDVSVPLYLLLDDHPRSYELFDSPRLVRAFYHVATHHAKSESASQVELYRRMAWEAYERGWNGWGFYSYYAPRGDPWNDFDTEWRTNEDRPDYEMVYAGPRGPVPTRPSEAVREGWEDYRLLYLLQQQGREKKVAELIEAYEGGRSLTELRLEALRAAAGGE